jgi:hypothetical protein
MQLLDTQVRLLQLSINLQLQYYIISSQAYVERDPKILKATTEL